MHGYTFLKMLNIDVKKYIRDKNWSFSFCFDLCWPIQIELFQEYMPLQIKFIILSTTWKWTLSYILLVSCSDTNLKSRGQQRPLIMAGAG